MSTKKEKKIVSYNLSIELLNRIDDYKAIKNIHSNSTALEEILWLGLENKETNSKLINKVETRLENNLKKIEEFFKQQEKLELFLSREIYTQSVASRLLSRMDLQLNGKISNDQLKDYEDKFINEAFERFMMKYQNEFKK